MNLNIRNITCTVYSCMNSAAFSRKPNKERVWKGGWDNFNVTKISVQSSSETDFLVVLGWILINQL